MVAFAERPADARSACIAVLEPSDGPATAVRKCRQTGAPIVFTCSTTGIEQWMQKVDEPEKIQAIDASTIQRFFAKNRGDLRPSRVYEAKTRGLFQRSYQLDFVDVGLMAVVESEIGDRLTSLIERGVRDLKGTLGLDEITDEKGHWLLQTVFWLVAAKILRDKQVPGFSDVALTDVDQVFSSLAQHYGARPVSTGTAREREALQGVAEAIDEHASLSHATTESLAYVYESALISKQTRTHLGTHSTPAYIADYLVWQLLPWIEKIPPNDRHVFEPACGAVVFLVSAMRAMREILPDSLDGPARRHRYFQSRLHGIDLDPFALEIARLSLTLADIPNPNGWDLQQEDVFHGQGVQERATQCTILLANPPFENFSTSERKGYCGLQQNNKAAEVLARTLPHLRPGAVFGLVVPQSLLHNPAAFSLRRLIAEEFELREICLLPDKVFKFSGAESALLLGRRPPRKRSAQVSLRYRRVRDWDMPGFKARYEVSSQAQIRQRWLAEDESCGLFVPELHAVWQYLSHLPRFGDAAEVGKGLSFKPEASLPEGVIRWSRRRFAGSRKGFVCLGRDVFIHKRPEEVWINVSPEVLRDVGAGIPEEGREQILLNYGRASRGPWRVKAFLDPEGHVVTSRFVAIRSLSEDLPIDFLWALCNSPLFSACVHAHTMKRDNLVRLVRSVPIPNVSQSEIRRVVTAARAYLDAALRPSGTLAQTEPEEHNMVHLITRLDAEVLRLYDLPPRHERQVLDLFRGWQRTGVAFGFCEYFPDDFEPCISLHEYLSEDYQRSTAGALRDRYEPARDPALLRALRRASEDFGE